MLADLEAQLQTDINPVEKAQVCLNIAEEYRKIGDWKTAQPYIEQALALQVPTLLGEATYQNARWYFTQAKWEEAEAVLQQAVEIFKTAHQTTEIGKCYNLIAALYTNQKIYPPALENFEQAIDWNVNTANTAQLGKVFYNLRVFLKMAMTPKNIEIFYLNWLEKAKSIDFPALLAFLHHNIGAYYQIEQYYDKAENHLEQALEMKLAHQIGYELGDTYYHLGSVHDQHQKYQTAIEYHVLALEHLLAGEAHDEVGIIVYYLQHSLGDCESPQIRQKGNELIAQAQARNLLPEISTEDTESITEALPQFHEDALPINLSFAESAAQVAERERTMSLTELQAQYQTSKSELPASAEKFAESAFYLLLKFRQTAQNAWFSKKKKQAAYEAQKAVVLAELTELQMNGEISTEVQTKIKQILAEI
jgi:tetratricopeptide (TPR) repeat protein